MALNLTQVFTAIGRAGRNAYLVNGAQDDQGAPFSQLAALAYVNPAWISGLSSSYDPLIRVGSSGMFGWTQAVTSVFLGLVSADNPVAGASLPNALRYLVEQMVAQSATVNECVITSTVIPDPANIGTGVAVVSTVRADGLTFQNTVAETSTLQITADSYTGGATANREPWQWSGTPNNSSLGTGTPVGLWDWDWPTGSGAAATGAAVAASAAPGSGAGATYLTNGNFAAWTTAGVTRADNWYLGPGTWGTTVEQVAGGIDGGFAVRFNAGATLNALTTQFGSSISDPTDPTAGTTSSLTDFTGYIGNVWLKATGVISAGVLTASLVDDTGAVVNDQAGTPNTATVTLSTVGSGAWENFAFAFRVPYTPPSILRLKLAITTALAGANLLMDWATLTLPTSLYPGGPNAAVFSNPEAPFEAAPDPDAFTLDFTNDRAGASYGATFQSLFSRVFQTPGLILPYDSPGTILDTLITAP